MYKLGRFFVNFGKDFILFENKSNTWILQVCIKDPRKSLLDTKRISLEQLDQMSSRFKGSSLESFYRKQLIDCVFLLEHLEEIQHLIIKHNL